MSGCTTKIYVYYHVNSDQNAQPKKCCRRAATLINTDTTILSKGSVIVQHVNKALKMVLVNYNIHI